METEDNTYLLTYYLVTTSFGGAASKLLHTI